MKQSISVAIVRFPPLISEANFRKISHRVNGNSMHRHRKGFVDKKDRLQICVSPTSRLLSMKEWQVHFLPFNTYMVFDYHLIYLKSVSKTIDEIYSKNSPEEFPNFHRLYRGHKSRAINRHEIYGRRKVKGEVAVLIALIYCYLPISVEDALKDVRLLRHSLACRPKRPWLPHLLMAVFLIKEALSFSSMD